MELKLTTKSQEALSSAVQAATTNGNPHVEPVHLLAALAAQPGGVPAGLLEAVGANPTTVIARAKAAISALPSAKGSTVAAPQLSRNGQSILVAAREEMSALGDSFVSTEHLLLALAADRGTAGEILRSLGAGVDQLRAALPQIRGSAKVDSADPEGTFAALEKYSVDLTEQAGAGKLDPVIGRDSEIRRVV
jgi:ATP-dependent Clp protease ATP-binding subunit ClpB